MTQERRFGGEIPPLVGASFHPLAVFVGAAAGLVAGLLLFAALKAGQFRLAPLLFQAVVGFFLVRFAQVYRTGGDPRGLHHAAVSFGDTGAAWGRLVTLNLVWSLPAVLAAKGLASLPAAVAGAPVGFAATTILIAAAVLPPAFLVVAVAARGFGEIFDFDLWHHCVLARRGEFATMLLLSVGTMLATASGALLLSLGLGGGHRTFTFFLLLTLGSHALGATLLLVGRLAGALLGPVAAAKPLRTWDSRADSLGHERSLDDVLAQATASARPDEPGHGAPSTNTDLAVEETPSPVDANEEYDVDESKTTPLGPDQPREGEATSLTARLRANERKAQEDALAALQELEDLLAEHGPHPMILVRKALLQHGLGFDEAADSAAQCVRAAVAVNNFGVLADLYENFGEALDLEAFDLATRQHMAGSLAARHHFEAALSLYRAILTEKPDHLPSIKALIQLADQHLRGEDRVPMALTIYDTLDEVCPDHPFADFVERGREDAERRLARSH